jgi:hypothetical protein
MAKDRPHAKEMKQIYWEVDTGLESPWNEERRTLPRKTWSKIKGKDGDILLLPCALLQRVRGIDDDDKIHVKRILLLASYKVNIFAYNHYTVTEGNFRQLFI